ncbi:MAG: VIT1/CCC1 transporter family protein [Chlamydiia bacterium]|nr:VIT1/CCC1 transporter family protein [Chlamydiia bacterium]
MGHAHFKGKEAIEHVAEKQAQGLIASSEAHGTEIPGHLSAATDAAKETAVMLMLVWAILVKLQTPLTTSYQVLIIFALAWLVWKSGRSAWLGWSRLERLHRILSQEKWEIEHHRKQEREELVVLYGAKGFEGKLLDDVVDVLMADGDRLLRVMVEEEMGISLETQEHPIKQGFGAAIGTAIASAACLGGLFLWHAWGLLVAGLIMIGCAAAFSARYERNRPVPATLWNLGIGIFAFGTVYFLIEFIFS